jgi:hypothetical protein
MAKRLSVNACKPVSSTVKELELGFSELNDIKTVDIGTQTDLSLPVNCARYIHPSTIYFNFFQIFNLENKLKYICKYYYNTAFL